MANLKQYTIQINGIEQSISAVDALNKQLDALEKKIDALQGKAVNAASTSSGGASRTAELSDEDKLLKQIEATQSRINQADMADYKVLLDKKQELKELVTEQKSMTAEARLTEGAYANTMLGMKQHLADIKAAMQTVDLGDTDTFKKLTKDANELNQKLLEIEKSYGQFGRNVGNYPSAAEGFKGLKIQVGDTVEEFVNARQALKALKQEMQTLNYKNDKGLISEEEVKRLEDLIPTVNQLESSIQDAGKPMDALMDTMQSIVALAQAGKGLAAFFGLDGSAVEESIKKLVALQNVMQSLQTIQKQLQTQEGFGKYFSKANSAIDAFVNKLLGVKNASNEAAKAEKAQETATTQLGNASKSATVAVKGLSMAIKAIGIGLLIGLVSKLVDAFSNLFKKSKESEDAIKGIDAAVAGLDRQTSKLMEKYDRLFDQGTITSAQRLTEQIKLQAEYTENLVEAMRQRQLMDENSKGVDFGDTIDDKNFFGISVRNIEDVKKEWKELQESVLNGDKQTYLDALNAGKTSAEYWIEGFKSKSEELDDTSKEILNDFIGRTVKAEKELKKALKDVENGVEGARERVKKAQQTIKDLEDEMNSDKILNSILANLDKLIPDEKVRKACMNILESLGMIAKGIEDETARTNKKFHDLLIGLLPEQEQELTRAKEQYENNLKELGSNFVARAVAAANYQKEVERINKKYVTNVTTTNTAVVDSDEETNKLRQRLMSDGLRKRLMQLDDEKRKTLEKIKGTEEQKLEILKLYNELSLKEITNYVDNVTKEYENLKNNIEKEISNLDISGAEKFIDKTQYYMNLNDFYNGRSRNESSKIIKEFNLDKGSVEELYNELLEIQNEYYKDSVKNQLVFYKTVVNTQKEVALMRKLQAEQDATNELNLWEEEQKKKVENLKATIADLEKLQGNASEQEKLDLERAKNQLSTIESEYAILREQKEINYWEKIRQIQYSYETEIKNLDLESSKERSKIYTNFYDSELQKFNDFSSKISAEISAQPEYVKGLEIIKINKTKENYKKIQKEVEVGLKNIKKDIEEFRKTYNSKENIGNAIISEEDFAITLSRLKDFEKQFTEESVNINEKLKELGGEWWGSIDRWIQEVGQAASQIMSSLSEITNNQYAEQIDQQQKYIEEYEKLLDKQKEKTQEYADAVKGIEDELSNARGDRRQQLIDNLNAEMAAQRASLAEQKRIEKEKEKAEHRKADLEYDQAVAEKKMSVAQAKLNAVMAVSMAAVNKWPIPAIPMMALAAAVGAAQVAAANSQYIPKPSYGDGGVIVGKAHKDGGVPAIVGNGYPVELEGQEYIIRKKTATQNIGLLDFVNKSEKKLRLEDFIDFYGSNSQVQKNVTSVRRRFENGGAIPSLRTDISINDRVLQAIEDYSNRPTIVSVVDIIDQTERLNEVKTISGLYN